MKKIILSALTVSALISCEKKENKPVENRDYAVLNGKVINLDIPVDSVYLMNEEQGKHAVKLNPDGTFTDTIRLANGQYKIKIGDEYGVVYLYDNEEVNLTTDYTAFDEQLKFEGEGKGAQASNAYLQSMLLVNKNIDDEAFNLEKEDFDKKIAALQNDFNQLMEENKTLDADLQKDIQDIFQQNVEGIKEYYVSRKEVQDKFTGKQAPNFSMQDINGKTVSLSDFRGKYVYVDIWATWCGPCKAEIPALKELEETYKGKDIVFISMSVDEPKDKEKWATFVKEKELKGVQLFTGEGWKNSFVENLEVRGIPRFVLIDRDGKIINPDADRPSSSNIKNVFDKLLNS